MKLRPSEFLIPSDDPFRHDVLDRKPFAEALTNLVKSVTPPTVLCLDAQWGRGKTTFLKMWKQSLENSGRGTALYFNAWQTDFASDPLAAFIGEITQLAQASNPDGKASERINQVKAIGAKLLKRALPVGIKIATAGIIDASDLTEEAIADLTRELSADAIEAYTSEKQLIDDFHKAIKALIDSLASRSDGTMPRLVILVDELDRCRPSYALELLERIKHVFNVENAVFVLAIDKQQLATSVRCIYGNETDSEEYLRRFMDLEFSLPEPPNLDLFTQYLFGQYQFNEIFAERKHPNLRYDTAHLIEGFNGLANLLNLNLRAREHCFARLRVALLATPNDHYIFPDMLVTLVVLYTSANHIYRQFVSKAGTVTQLIEFLRSKAGGPEFLESHFGTLLEAFLIAAKAGRMRNEVKELAEYKKVAEAAVTGSEEESNKSRAQKILRHYAEMHFRDGQVASLEYLTAIVEMGVRKA